MDAETEVSVTAGTGSTTVSSSVNEKWKERSQVFLF